FTDVRLGRIPNWLTYPTWVFGVIFAATAYGWPGLKSSLLGFAVGFVPFFLLYLVGGMGGGDVKLMAAVGAIMGYPFILNAVITSILVGGLVALLIVIWEGKLWQAVKYLAATVGKAFVPGLAREPLTAKQNVPFGVAICLGAFLTLIAVWLGYTSPAQLLMGLA
ncbi:MAG: prepilin peptidase, partial [FCB group bacterium]|nr:prepilin peptidase [FCB group bacterium]